MAASGSDGSAAREQGDTTVSRNQAADDAWANPASRPAFRPVLHLNKTTFTSYHRLGTELRIVNNGGATATPTLEASIAPEAAASGAGAQKATPAVSAPASAEPAAPGPQPSATPLASSGPPPEPAQASEMGAQPATPPATVEGERKDHAITLYTLSTCGFCKKAMAFLNREGYSYRYIHVDNIPLETKTAVKKTLKELYHADVAFPFAVVDSAATLVGFIEPDWKLTLGVKD
jgi:glutaredoxin